VKATLKGTGNFVRRLGRRVSQGLKRDVMTNGTRSIEPCKTPADLEIFGFSQYVELTTIVEE